MPACHVRRLSAQSGTLECISSKAWTRWLFQFLGWFGKHTKLKLHNLEVEQLKPLKKWMGKEGHDPFGSFWVSWNLPTKGAPQRLSTSPCLTRIFFPYLQESLQKLSFGHGFNRSLEKATLPKNLQALCLGSSKKKRLSCPQWGNLRMHYKRCIISCRFSTKMLDNDVFVDIYWKISFSWISLVLVHDIIYVYL